MILAITLEISHSLCDIVYNTNWRELHMICVACVSILFWSTVQNAHVHAIWHKNHHKRKNTTSYNESSNWVARQTEVLIKSFIQNKIDIRFKSKKNWFYWCFHFHHQSWTHVELVDQPIFHKHNVCDLMFLMAFLICSTLWKTIESWSGMNLLNSLNDKQRVDTKTENTITVT